METASCGGRRLALGENLLVLSPGKIGSIQLSNRFIRSATSESMADESGIVTDEYVCLHRALAQGGVGLIFSGHCYVHDGGKYSRRQTGMHTDAVIARLQSVTRAVHANRTPIFAQLSHAGSQTRIPSVVPIAPSAIANPQTGRVPRVTSDDEIWAIIEAFGNAAKRAREAGFDGVHIHAGHGYLLSEFLSPYTNRRADQWGGSGENRQRLLLEVVRQIRSSAGPDFPVSVKLGMKDFVDGGLQIEESLVTAKSLAAAGVQAIEVSAGLTSPAIESVVQYAGLTRRRALQDKLIHRLFAASGPEAYFEDLAAMVKTRVMCPTILVGGLRSIEKMECVVRSMHADFVSLARPLIREPNLVNEVRAGRRGFVDCTSCNICQSHDGFDSLQCWRKSVPRLMRHAVFRITSQLRTH